MESRRTHNHSATTPGVSCLLVAIVPSAASRSLYSGVERLAYDIRNAKKRDWEEIALMMCCI